jgi:hypothetical protein
MTVVENVVVLFVRHVHRIDRKELVNLGVINRNAVTHPVGMCGVEFEQALEKCAVSHGVISFQRGADLGPQSP